jgi:hypothetical protein
LTTAKYNRLPIYILVGGLISGLLYLANYSLIYVIGYGAIYTALFVTLVIMYLLIITYRRFINVDLTIFFSIVISLPIFFMLNLFADFLPRIIYSETRVYSSPWKDDLLNNVMEALGKSLPVTLFFAFIFLPLYRVFRKKTISDGSTTA